jgi:hypothetical protein
MSLASRIFGTKATAEETVTRNSDGTWSSTARHSVTTYVSAAKGEALVAALTHAVEQQARLTQATVEAKLLEDKRRG